MPLNPFSGGLTFTPPMGEQGTWFQRGAPNHGFNPTHIAPNGFGPATFNAMAPINAIRAVNYPVQMTRPNGGPVIGNGQTVNPYGNSAPPPVQYFGSGG